MQTVRAYARESSDAVRVESGSRVSGGEVEVEVEIGS
jgi:hypothetical protein